MSTARVIKQTSYAVGCLLVLGMGLGSIIFFIVQANQPVRPASLPSPSPEKFQPLRLEDVSIVRHPTNIDVVARLRNPNARAGVEELPVEVVVLNARGEELHRVPIETYVLPGSLQYVVALNVPVVAADVSVRIDLPSQPNFQLLPESLDLPVFGAFLRERATRQIGDAAIEEQKGIVRNNGTFDLQRVELVAVASDAEGRVVGVGKTFLGALRVNEQREFTVQWPAPPTPTTSVITLLTTNVFREETLIRVIGDPSTLR